MLELTCTWKTDRLQQKGIWNRFNSKEQLVVNVL